MGRLTKDEIMAMTTLVEKGETYAGAAKRFAVDESTVRYHVTRQGRDDPSADGRQKPALIDALELAEAVDDWWQTELAGLPAGRSPNATALHAWLQAEHGYAGSVKSVRKYIRTHYKRPPLRPFRRVELPPGAQVQVDWSEHRDVTIGDDEPQTLYVFHMTLAHSRRQVDIACLGCDQQWWHYAHLEAFKRLGGVTAVSRIDNLKTGISTGSGVWGVVNEAYAGLARELGFHVDACPVRMPRAKGKVERGVRTLRTAGVCRIATLGLDALQGWLDQEGIRRDSHRICPVTGTTVMEAWESERAVLRPLPTTLPKPFDTVVQRRVSRDCLVSFESRQYSVPYRHHGTMVEVRGLTGMVEFRDATGTVIKRWPRQTQRRLLVDPADYDGEDTALQPAPLPLGALGKRLVALGDDGVQRRSIDIYEAVADVIAARDARVAEVTS